MVCTTSDSASLGKLVGTEKFYLFCVFVFFALPLILCLPLPSIASPRPASPRPAPPRPASPRLAFSVFLSFFVFLESRHVGDLEEDRSGSTSFRLLSALSRLSM